MSEPAANPGQMAIVNVELKVGDRRLKTTISVPAAPMRLVELLPIVQSIANGVVDQGVAEAEAQGKRISCTKGCGACCRQLVPITEVEARRIGQLVAEMPPERRAHVEARFADAQQRLTAVGIWDELLAREGWDEAAVVDIGKRYFDQGVACPFLEEESCSIHLDRPITCREYLVTSPAINCACPTKDNIEKVAMPMPVWTALARFDETAPDAKYCRWVPLVMAPQWAAAHPEEPPPRPGPELVRELFERLSRQPAPQESAGAPGPV